MRFRVLAFCALGVLATRAEAQDLLPGEGPRLDQVGVTITQDEIESGVVSLQEIRRQGRLVFSTPFNEADGYGDGSRPDPADTVSPGGRPTLQDNGTFLRVNGLDGQSCLECHSIVSHRTVPTTFGIGGVGGAVSNAIFQPTRIDVDDGDSRGFAFFNGRFINPPFLFGSGGVQLLANEMTADLQALAVSAAANPGVDVPLTSKGVNFGTIRYVDGQLDTSNVQGIDADLVVRPYGRKGEFATVRSFDLDALAFHFGMQAVEAFGSGDPDGDGVSNEILPGEVSALEIFTTTLEPPRQERPDADARAGAELFVSLGCAACHVPFLETRSRFLGYRFPENASDPAANVYYRVDLARAPTGFHRTKGGGLRIPLFADLKRHDMGPALAESFGSDLDAQFTTARLWGVSDTAPYLHDGRATTLGAAIRLHGGEAQAARDAFAALNEVAQAQLLGFLQTLRTPRNPGVDLGPPVD